MASAKAHIVDRLRDTTCDREPFTPSHAECRCLLAHEAANAIEKLQRAIVCALDCLNHDDATGALKSLRKA